jgi:hypothetical protein
MSLSQRLKEAEQERRRSAGLPPEPPIPTDVEDGATEPAEAVVDVSGPTADVIDLTQRTATSAIPLGPSGAAGIAYDPVRHGDASSAFGDPAPVDTDRMSTHPCPRCGGRTQVDLIDQVHQTVSLSCLSCFHMFRVEQS